MSYKNFKFDIDADGIALVTWDMPGKSMNVIDQRNCRRSSTRSRAMARSKAWS
jgi:3-hydroxyacyl-CoA dehydrogenase/enoyl-CoA hydratase/3-hydroxybutyryl-CoA epimerase